MRVEYECDTCGLVERKPIGDPIDEDCHECRTGKFVRRNYEASGEIPPTDKVLGEPTEMAFRRIGYCRVRVQFVNDDGDSVSVDINRDTMIDFVETAEQVFDKIHADAEVFDE